MTPGFTIRNVTPGVAAELAANLRPADRAELIAGGHPDTERGMHEAVHDSIAASTWAREARMPDGTLYCVFGLALYGRLLSPTGCPWMLGTPQVTKHPRNLVALAPGYIRDMLRDCVYLRNTVHARNTFAVRWLKHAGFTLHPERDGFQVFEMHRHV